MSFIKSLIIYRSLKGIFIILFKLIAIHRIPGFIRSALIGRSVSKDGEPIPWYTYPAIGFLNGLNSRDLRVLEFGAGYSTLWWSKRCKHVTSFEGDREWFDRVVNTVPNNVTVRFTQATGSDLEGEVKRLLGNQGIETFDIIIIDGLNREVLLDFTLRHMSATSILIFDNSEGYSVYDISCCLDLCRVDFFGDSPGVLQLQNTSIFFKGAAKALSSSNRIQSKWSDI